MRSTDYELPGPLLVSAMAVLGPGSPAKGSRMYGPSLPRRPRRG
jgi:hypothetical protein